MSCKTKYSTLCNFRFQHEIVDMLNHLAANGSENKTQILKRLVKNEYEKLKNVEKS